MFHPGDKVRFLNESIEGVVVTVHSGDRVEVRDKDGFTHITGRKDLVPVEFGLAAESFNKMEERLQESSPEPLAYEKPVQVKGQAELESSSRFIQYFEPDETIYALVNLLNPGSPLTTDVEIWLINNTSYFISFVATREKSDYRSNPVAGLSGPRSEYRLGIYTQDELHLFNGFEVQFLFYRNDLFQPRSPIVKHFEILPGELLGMSTAKTWSSQDPSLKKPLVVLRQEEVDVSKLVQRFNPGEEEIRAAAISRKNRVKSQFTFVAREKIVDLHIEELLKDHSGMTPSQIIAYQLEVFDKEMDKAILHHYNKITFIHGIGAGVLKSAIREALKKYGNVRYGDAPPERFGNGATLVEFV